MNVVTVGGCLPYPANTGGRLRTLNLLVRLARRHRITYLATRNPDRAEASAALAYLADHGIEPVEIEHTVLRKSGPRFYARLAANLASTLPYSVASHHAPAINAEVARRAKTAKVDVWQAEWAGGMEAFRGLPDTSRTVVIAPNVETLIWERYAETETQPLRRLYIRKQARKFARYERDVWRHAGRVVAVTREDAALMTGRFGVPAERIDVVDNGLDRGFYETVSRSHDHDPARILFLGSLDWRPNLDAVSLLLDRLFPAVREAVPNATLEIVGRNPPASLAAKAEATPGVSLHANVPDVRPFLARAGVMAVPLRVGGGSRLKILEALGSGVPVVSSAVGMEGLALRPGVDLSVVDDATMMADALIDAVRRPGVHQSMAATARPRVLAQYDWDALADALEESWLRCAGRSGSSRHKDASLAAV
ncbi:MAG: glycosyltransferase [Isosphaeraceae bacterium]